MCFEIYFYADMVGSSTSGSASSNAPNTPGAAANYYYRKRFPTEEDPMDDFDDPDPLPEDASDEQREAYGTEMKNYCTEMISVFKESSLQGKQLWLEFCSSFRYHTLQYLDRAQSLCMVQLLISRGVFVNRRKGLSRIRALSQCIEQESFIPYSASTGDKQLNEEEEEGVPQTSTAKENVAKSNTRPSEEENSKENTNVLEQSMAETHDQESQRKSHGLRISGFMRAYQGRQKFNGNIEDDFSTAVNLFNTLSRLCRLSENEKAEAVPIMLNGEALSYYSTV